MMTSTPSDPSQKIPPEARGRVRRTKKKPSGGGRGSSTAVESASQGGGVGAGELADNDRTFVTSRGFPEDDSNTKQHRVV